MKRVIFVGGTSYSGSTFFDMVLGNDPHGFSCGEVYALFWPHRAHHVRPTCGCGDPECGLWPAVKERGEERLYETIFERRPEAEFIVDSSKNLFWIRRQAERLHEAGIGVRHVLIWKTPAEISRSYGKWGRETRWPGAWLRYHRLYFRFIPDFRAIPYARLATDPAALEPVCRFLGIEYSEGKREFWHRTHHTVFGHPYARIHAQARDRAAYRHVEKELLDTGGTDAAEIEKRFQTVYYEPPDPDAAYMPASKRKVRRIEEVRRCLERCDVTGPGPDDAVVKALALGPTAARFARIRDIGARTVSRLAWRFHLDRQRFA
jgi:hypothetical protein